MDSEADAGMQFEIVYSGMGEEQVVMESMEPVLERERGNRRQGVDLCRQ